MHVSAKKLSQKDTQELFHQLITVITDLKTEQEASDFLEDFFSETEKVILTKRLSIAILLEQGKSYDEIAKKIHVSSATISSVGETLKKKGMQLALQKIHDDRWAEDKVARLKKLLPF